MGKTGDVVVERYTERLSCALSRDEIHTIATEKLPTLRKTLEHALAEQKAIVKEHRDRVASAKLAHRDVERMLETQSEIREVKCEKQLHLNSKEVVCIRLDNGDELERRTMAAHEVQQYCQTTIDEISAPMPTLGGAIDGKSAAAGD